MSFKNKQVLITGGSGGLGALLTRQFVGDGAQVTVLDRAEPSAGVKFIRADLSTADGLEAAASAVAGGDW
ncbi:MAG TPA: NAD-dependent epimerase/dehydratase family protein, partial [Phenylobacterium sp.]|nr:NAD-dependent epimerase/dehydratase family protein [Phenylobacterium sp.]